MGSFDNAVQGSYGMEKVAQSTKIGGLPLGTRMVLPDGRLFAHAKASATALIAGNLYQGKAGEANTIFVASLDTTTAAVGANSVLVTMSGTVLAADVYADGYIFFASGSSSGSTYKVKSHAAAGSSGSATIILDPNDTLVEAVAGDTTKAGLRKNEFDSITITTGDTVGVNSLAGVATRDVTANYYCWVQRRGLCAVLTDGTPIVGIAVTASTAVDGAVAPLAIAAADTAGTQVRVADTPVGFAVSVAASASYSLIDLKLE